MSYRSTIIFTELEGGTLARGQSGELHLYDTCDPAFTDGNTDQRRLGLRLPCCPAFPEGLDYDEPFVFEDVMAGKK